MTGPRLRAVREIVVGAAQVSATLITSPLVRRRYNRWGATPAEVAADMPGDDLVPAPRLGYTRAVTVDAPVDAVWPWVAQLGQGRGGMYSFDGLENLVGCGIHSADTLLPEHQLLALGDLIRMGPVGYPCFRVRGLRAPTELVLVGADPRPPHAEADPRTPAGAATWQFLLTPTDGDRTRLVVRQRLGYSGIGSALSWHVVEPIGFVMERQMLLGISRRAAQATRAA
jgi:hypothetical protein